jgi:hypothetical protein
MCGTRSIYIGTYRYRTTGRLAEIGSTQEDLGMGVWGLEIVLKSVNVVKTVSYKFKVHKLWL